MPRPFPLHVLARAGVLGIALLALAGPGQAIAGSQLAFPTASRAMATLVFTGLPSPPRQAAAIELAQPSHRLTAAYWPPPTPYDQLPVNDSVRVFIPLGSAPPVPNATPGHSPDLTLTFDDCGSAEQIQAVVDALAAVHRQGIFFITGQCRDHYPWLVGTLTAAGHQVCDHTYSHPDLRRLNDAAIRSEIGGGVRIGCQWFRPPYGAWDGPRGRVARIAGEYGLQVLLWDVDSRDWAGAPADRIAAVARARGGVILLHLHGAHTAEAIRLIG